ncbi:MAG: TIGR02757 family protein [Cyclobacteriaceae bacterium]|nr:TIGR02757 family protein [Cyclobacteriaceae bacterium]
MDTLKKFLEENYRKYNVAGFIENDPISIPHQFTIKQDVEIAGFFAAILAWGQRKTIIKKCLELLEYMGNEPYSFVLNHSENDLLPLERFKHRTFQPTDALYFIAFLKKHYQQHESLEAAFQGVGMKERLINFQNNFFRYDFAPARTKKHIASPASNSACKRLNMFLRWMVRKDDQGVDFGIWKQINPSELICPYDVHVERVAKKLGLVKRKQTDWKAAEELTNNLRSFDPRDPVKYDFALFGLGVDNII